LLSYDSNRSVVVTFGGADNCPNRNGTNETWEYDGVDWRQINTPHSPPPRYYGGMTYDSQRRVMVLFGGFAAYYGPAYNDTWEYDGTDWHQVALTFLTGYVIEESLSADNIFVMVLIFTGRPQPPAPDPEFRPAFFVAAERRGRVRSASRSTFRRARSASRCFFWATRAASRSFLTRSRSFSASFL
jgi:hypothetical protein